MVELETLLQTVMEKRASDLHLTTGAPPQFRVDGKLASFDTTSLNATDTKRLCYSLLTDAQRHKFEEENELDFSFGIKGLSRFRGNIYMQRGAVAGAFRAIPFDILGFSELGILPIANELIKKPKGLVLVTGPTGTGKSTTLAAMIDKINQERNAHIITIEDPIEYLHKHKKCIINQREVHSDTKSFSSALRHILRQDPDVILIGEMRDLETIEAALITAETGHLTFDPPHEFLCGNDQSHHRCLPALSTAANPNPTLVCARRGLCPAASPPSERSRTRAGHGGDDPKPGHSKPDPRGQDPADLFVDAGGTG